MSVATYFMYAMCDAFTRAHVAHTEELIGLSSHGELGHAITLREFDVLGFVTEDLDRVRFVKCPFRNQATARDVFDTKNKTIVEVHSVLEAAWWIGAFLKNKRKQLKPLRA